MLMLVLLSDRARLAASRCVPHDDVRSLQWRTGSCSSAQDSGDDCDRAGDVKFHGTRRSKKSKSHSTDKGPFFNPKKEILQRTSSCAMFFLKKLIFATAFARGGKSNFGIK